MRDSSESVYALADAVRDLCLVECRSLLAPAEAVWTSAAAGELQARFVNEPDLSHGSFLGKLAGQLADASLPAIRLMAELTVIYEMVPVNVGVAAKRRMVEGVLAIAGDLTPLPERVLEAFTGGIANPGLWYLTRPDVQLMFLTRFAVAITALGDDERRAVMADPWEFRDLLRTVPLASGYGQRAALMHLMFPDTFESIIASRDKGRILDFYADRLPDRTGDEDLDMLALRETLTEVRGVPHLFYRPPWDGWRSKKPTTTGWLVRAPRADGGDFVPGWLAGSYCSLSVADVPEIAAGTSLAKIGDIVAAALPDLSNPERRSRVNAIDRFMNRVKNGDLVVTVHGPDILVGRISGPPVWENSVGTVSTWRRDVRWLNADHPLAPTDLSAGTRGKISGQNMVTDLGIYADEIFALVEADEIIVTDGSQDPEASLTEPVSLELPDPTQALANTLFLPLPWLRELVDLLREKGQIVLYGPPGTGKTYLAQAIATFLTETTGGDQRLVQFHPSYAYEDFFEGFRPRPGNTPGTIVFDLVPGPLRRIAALAEADPTRPYVLIIDELNRANLAKVFGELYFLLEYRDKAVSLQYSPDEDFSLPRNLLVIATMNTADRSIALVDQAMRRRFDFIPLFPGRDPLVGMLRDWLAANAIPPTAADLLDALNTMLANPDSAVGPSYFMSDRARSRAGLERIWRTAILPLLEDRFAGGDIDVHTTYALDAVLARIGAGPEPVAVIGISVEHGDVLGGNDYGDDPAGDHV